MNKQIQQAISVSRLQCRYPVHIWKDAESEKLRMDTYNHTNSLITTKVLLAPSTTIESECTYHNTGRMCDMGAG